MDSSRNPQGQKRIRAGQPSRMNPPVGTVHYHLCTTVRSDLGANPWTTVGFLEESPSHPRGVLEESTPRKTEDPHVR